jgi:IS5 family transposase
MLPHAAIRGLNCMAQKHGMRLRQSYLRIANRATRRAERSPHLHARTEASRVRRYQAQTQTLL